MKSPVLSVRSLKKSFRSSISLKRHEALKGVSFELEAGVVTGFLGSNGAGKTTTIKCLLGLIFPDEGEVSFFGQGYNTEAIKRRIGFLPERPYFYEYLTAAEYLRFMGRLSGLESGRELEKRVDELLDLVELPQAKNKSLRGFSKGMLQRVGIAQSIIHRPEFVILDEPMSGLDPDGRYKINQIMRDIADSGTTVFFSSHLLNDAELLCKNLVILSKGNLVYSGRMEDLLNKMKVGHILQYRESGQVRVETLPDEVQLQKRIDEVRSQGATILEVRVDRPSLEKVFVAVSGGAPT